MGMKMNLKLQIHVLSQIIVHNYDITRPIRNVTNKTMLESLISWKGIISHKIL
jgi:hypothetical protein